jgi:hypothetical protein
LADKTGFYTFYICKAALPLSHSYALGDTYSAVIERRLSRNLKRRSRPPDFSRSIAMMDAVMLAIAFAFFALSIGYVYACDRL